MQVTDCLQYAEALLITVCIIFSKAHWIILANQVCSRSWKKKVGLPEFASERRRKWGVAAILMPKQAQRRGSCKHLAFGGLFPRNNIHGFPKKLLI